ncbi:MAG TPA: hypothetical protein VFC28_07710 [Opitutaceae bacterium]|nr:hypothetical protein [Opitutaceae bacterium]
MNDENSHLPKYNWPLICGGIAVAILVAGLALGLIAMYVANFNLLEWME